MSSTNCNKNFGKQRFAETETAQPNKQKPNDRMFLNIHRINRKPDDQIDLPLL